MCRPAAEEPDLAAAMPEPQQQQIMHRKRQRLLQRQAGPGTVQVLDSSTSVSPSGNMSGVAVSIEGDICLAMHAVHLLPMTLDT